jgi:hypothetical protein
MPTGITIDNSNLFQVENVTIDHMSSHGFTSAAQQGVGFGPDQTIINNIKVSVCTGNGMSVRHGHSWHMRGGTIEFCEVGMDVFDINSVFVQDFDIESNRNIGVRISSGNNMHFSNCTFEANAGNLVSTDDAKVHIQTGLFNDVHATFSECYLHANFMRHLVRIDRGHVSLIRCFVMDGRSGSAFVGGGNSRGIVSFSRTATVDVDNLGEICPTGINRNVPLINNFARLRRFYGSSKTAFTTTVPTEGTYEVGDRIDRLTVAATGARSGWVCTAAGTLGGTPPGSPTAATTAASSTVTVSNASGLQVGDYITITGVATGPHRILSRAATGGGLLVDPVPDATVAAGAVTFAAPTLVPDSVQSTGTTAQRPPGLGSADVGLMHFDATLSKPVWWTGTAWTGMPVILSYNGSAYVVDNDARIFIQRTGDPAPTGLADNDITIQIDA